MALGYERVSVQMRIHGMNESQPLLVGSSVTLTVVTTGASGGQTYLWAREDGRPVPNASNAPSYMFTPLTKDGTVGGVAISCTVTDALARAYVSKSVLVQSSVEGPVPLPGPGRVVGLSQSQLRLILVVVGGVGLTIVLAAVVPFLRARRWQRISSPRPCAAQATRRASFGSVLAHSSESGDSDVAVANLADSLDSSDSIVSRVLPSRRLTSVMTRMSGRAESTSVGGCVTSSFLHARSSLSPLMQPYVP